MKDILKNKSVMTALGISVGILLLVIIFSPKQSGESPSTSMPEKSNYTPLELADLSKDKRRAAMVYVESIESKLPIYLETFKTSVGITTTINISRLKDDPAEIVNLEIYGLSYMNKDELDPKKNPNIVAFKESYLKALELLESKNIDPKKLIFVYGDKEYVRQTSNLWVDKLKLAP